MKKNILSGIPHKIRVLRAEKKLTQDQFADEIGYGRTKVADIERGAANADERFKNLVKARFAVDLSESENNINLEIKPLSVRHRQPEHLSDMQIILKNNQGEKESSHLPNHDKESRCDCCRTKILLEWIESQKLLDLGVIKNSEDFQRYAGKKLYEKGYL